MSFSKDELRLIHSLAKDAYMRLGEDLDAVLHDQDGTPQQLSTLGAVALSDAFSSVHKLANLTGKLIDGHQ